jgi:AcrR family transcriptional regulator
MARRKDQAARREQLRKSALKVLRSKGLVNTRLRDIAEAAGLNPTTVLYYYPDMEQLHAEALRTAQDRFYDERRRAVLRHTDARDRLATMIESGLPTDSTDWVARLAWEALAFEFHDSTLAELDRQYVDRQIDLYEAIVDLGQQQGHFAPAAPLRDVATNLLALEDYHGMRILLGWTSRPEAKRLIDGYAAQALGSPTLPQPSPPADAPVERRAASS